MGRIDAREDVDCGDVQMVSISVLRHLAKAVR
jgi:hypothetical protein